MDTDTDRQRVVQWGDPTISSSAARTLSGRAFLEGMRDGTLPPPPFVSNVGLHFAEIGDGLVVFTLEPREDLYNGIGIVHGGVTATLCDSAAGCAVTSITAPGEVAVTLDLSVRYFLPIDASVGTLRCEGRVISRSRNYATAEARVFDASGNIHAHATSTLAITRPGAKR
ncbi:MAG: PaaI family thioesterase [Candidatus Velthaea sp.]|jgi:uncharacterized protein (TIGR00369 family)